MRDEHRLTPSQNALLVGYLDSMPLAYDERGPVLFRSRGAVWGRRVSVVHLHVRFSLHSHLTCLDQEIVCVLSPT